MIITSAVDISIHAVSPVSISRSTSDDIGTRLRSGHGRKIGSGRARVGPAPGPRRCRFGAARTAGGSVCCGQGVARAQVAIVGPHQTDAAMIT